jgi:membrane-bound serine protease (ClpP class)
VYNLSFNWWAIVILLLGVIPFIYAIQKPKRELFLGLAILLIVLGSVFIFPRTDKQPSVNPLLAVVSSGLMAGFIWIAVRKSMEALHTRPSISLEGLVGQTGEAKTKIHEEGSAQVLAELWSARSESPIPAGSSIRVVKREGFILVVEKSKTSKP